MLEHINRCPQYIQSSTYPSNLGISLVMKRCRRYHGHPTDEGYVF